MIYLGIDDTDNLESRGTGRLAREVATELSKKYRVFGVTRHQFYVHESIPFTSHNSGAVIHIDEPKASANIDIFNIAKRMMLDDFVEGSDPGIAVALDEQVDYSVTALGIDAKKMVLTQDRARTVASNAGILLEGLGGTEDGVIGAVSGIGLAITGNDGRFLLKGRNRDLGSVHSVGDILSAGIDRVMMLDGRAVNEGNVVVEKARNPSFVRGKAVLFVEERDGKLCALKRD